jgi:hypothetical protein
LCINFDIATFNGGVATLNGKKLVRHLTLQMQHSTVHLAAMVRHFAASATLSGVATYNGATTTYMMYCKTIKKSKYKI